MGNKTFSVFLYLQNNLSYNVHVNNFRMGTFYVFCQGLRCVISWTQFGLTLEDIDKLGSYCITSCLKDDDLFEVAVDALVEITTSPSSYR